jgi:hypothetical protein
MDAARYMLCRYTRRENDCHLILMAALAAILAGVWGLDQRGHRRTG